MANLNEAAVEAAALEWFAQLGYAVSGPWESPAVAAHLKARPRLCLRYGLPPGLESPAVCFASRYGWVPD